MVSIVDPKGRDLTHAPERDCAESQPQRQRSSSFSFSSSSSIFLGNFDEEDEDDNEEDTGFSPLSNGYGIYESALNYELTLAGPLTKLPALLNPLPSKGTSQCSNGLVLSPRCEWQSNGDNNRWLGNSKSGENFAKKGWQ